MSLEGTEGNTALGALGSALGALLAQRPTQASWALAWRPRLHARCAAERI